MALPLTRDGDFRPSVIKGCAYFPSPAKIWVNGTSTVLDGVVK
jgi:hypothetical protein